MNTQFISTLPDFILTSEASATLINKIEVYARIEKADVAAMREKGNNGLADAAGRNPYRLRVWIVTNSVPTGKGESISLASMPTVSDIQQLIGDVAPAPAEAIAACAENIYPNL